LLTTKYTNHTKDLAGDSVLYSFRLFCLFRGRTSVNQDEHRRWLRLLRDVLNPSPNSLTPDGALEKPMVLTTENLRLRRWLANAHARAKITSP
jgi:hypothetical protein